MFTYLVIEQIFNTISCFGYSIFFFQKLGFDLRCVSNIFHKDFPHICPKPITTILNIRYLLWHCLRVSPRTQMTSGIFISSKLLLLFYSFSIIFFFVLDRCKRNCWDIRLLKKKV